MLNATKYTFSYGLLAIALLLSVNNFSKQDVFSFSVLKSSLITETGKSLVNSFITSKITGGGGGL